MFKLILFEEKINFDFNVANKYSLIQAIACGPNRYQAITWINDDPTHKNFTRTQWINMTSNSSSSRHESNWHPL